MTRILVLVALALVVAYCYYKAILVGYDGRWL